MRIYLLAEGQPGVPTETVKSVHTTLAAAVGHAVEVLEVPVGKWIPHPPVDVEFYGYSKLWEARDTYWNFYITEWETSD